MPCFSRVDTTMDKVEKQLEEVSLSETYIICYTKHNQKVKVVKFTLPRLTNIGSTFTYYSSFKNLNISKVKTCKYGMRVMYCSFLN